MQLTILFVCAVLNLADAQGLKVGYYEKTCPSVEKIVKQATAKFMSRAPTLAAPLLRMHFHDCFVRVIDGVKTAVESKCPGVVSCADILALVARDAVSMLKGPVPYWKVPLGRRDGRVSIMQDTFTNLPPPFFNISQLKSSFASKGLNVKDLVVLSGT
uniref:peroxidase n=1 Tax=Daucus carota subsp. sativus TaxID=79200 RepID=A0A165Z6Y7_DAUCS